MAGAGEGLCDEEDPGSRRPPHHDRRVDETERHRLLGGRAPNSFKVELACYKFETPEGFRAADVLIQAYRLRVKRGDHHITEVHLADAIESLLASRERSY
jgi:hypothetical protein